MNQHPSHDQDLERARQDCFKPPADRFQLDLQRAREFIELARPRVHVPDVYPDQTSATNGEYLVSRDQTDVTDGGDVLPRSITEDLFYAYTCKRCSSYLHADSDHRSQYGEAPPQ